MGKRVILSVAGSGKTAYIIDQLEIDSCALLITYTENNTKNIKERVASKFGFIPEGIKILSYFSFIYSFCFRPLCGYELSVKGINFVNSVPVSALRTNKKSYAHYFDSHSKIYSNRIAKFLLEFNIMPEVLRRIERYFDHVFIDEVQDFAANDFNFICKLSGAKVGITLVGDFYQHTYDTSSDGNTRKNLHKSFDRYCAELSSAGYELDKERLSKSYRCPAKICSFVSSKMGVLIESYDQYYGEVKTLEDELEIECLINDDNIVKLFYRSSDNYVGNTNNWGNVKGLDDFVDVCVVLNNRTFDLFKKDRLSELSDTTRNKLYVACTRTKRNLYFVEEARLGKYKKP